MKPLESKLKHQSATVAAFMEQLYDNSTQEHQIVFLDAAVGALLRIVRRYSKHPEERIRAALACAIKREADADSPPGGEDIPW